LALVVFQTLVLMQRVLVLLLWSCQSHSMCHHHML
jgi:hypothetical protein